MSALRSGFGIAGLVGLLAFPCAAPAAADDGDLDPSFGGGAFTVGWGPDDARAKVVEPIAGGELLVGGVIGTDLPGDIYGWAVAKLEADGSRDLVWALAFEIVDAGDETMAVSDELFDLHRVADGRTYLAGVAYAGIGNDVPMLARLAPSGALDDSFDGNGIRLLLDRPAEWSNIETDAAAVLPDGRSVFAGTCEDCPVANESWVWVTRRLADGSADPAFSGDGWLSFRFADEGSSTPSAIAVDESGRIVVGGFTSLLIQTELYLARLAPSGAFDGAFGGGDGIAGPWDTNAPDDLALDPSSGRIAIGVGTNNSLSNGRVRVFTAAGDADVTFSGDGEVELDREEGTSIYGVEFQSDGKLLAVGSIDANGANQGGFFLARLTTTGALDSSFDDNGVKRVEFDAAANVADGAFAVTTMAGRLVAVGYAGAGGGADQEFAVVRTESALVFADGFERGSTGAWAGQ